MRLAQVGTVALTFMFGCVRFGYDPLRAPLELTPDAASGGGGAAHEDAGGRADASVLDAGSLMDARVADSPRDAAEHPAADAASEPDASDDSGSSAGAAGDGGMMDRCPGRPDALFCDDFEDAALSRWTYVLLTNGTVEQTTALHHAAGKGSLYASTGATGASSSNTARYGVAAFDHQKSGEIWVRYYYYLPSSVTVDQGFSTVVVSEIEPPYFGFSLMILPSQVNIGVLDKMYPATIAFPRDKWTCVELHVRIAMSGVFEAYLGGALAVSSPMTNTVPGQGYTSLDVGIHYTVPSQGPVTAYVDDIVASNKRVPCDVAPPTMP